MDADSDAGNAPCDGEAVVRSSIAPWAGTDSCGCDATAMAAFHLTCLENDAQVFACDCDAAVEIGRQTTDDPAPVVLRELGDGLRLVVTPHEDTSVGRRQFRIVPKPQGALQLKNIGGKNSVLLGIGGQGQLLAPGESIEVAEPVSIRINRTRVVVVAPAAGEDQLSCLPEATLAPGQWQYSPGAVLDLLGKTRSTQTLTLIRALQVAMDAFQRAKTNDDLYAAAVKGARELAALDSACIVWNNSGVWEEACPGTGGRGTIQRAASRSVLSKVREQRRVFWNDALASANSPESLMGLEAVIAAPILAADGTLRGALYGDRKHGLNGPAAPRIDELTASLLELVACGVASGLARLAYEDQARRLRVQFEQFFSPELARELEARPDLLVGRDVFVTILFCDIRGFSRLSERTGPAETFEWVGDVIEALSVCVTKHDGVLVDYIGDELMAMWGAPREQPNHAELACRAAIDMHRSLGAINERWQRELGEPVAVGIGINSGHCRAGNCGSKQKFKYGPRGNPVNLASRVQGATRRLDSPILVTASTEAELCRLGVRDRFLIRKVCDCRVVNIEEPVGLFEIRLDDSVDVRTLCCQYGQALEQFNSRDFPGAVRLLTELIERFPNDHPSRILFGRATNVIVKGPDPMHPIWELASK